jgi:hypothetical protein
MKVNLSVIFDAKNREFIIESSANLLKPITEIKRIERLPTGKIAITQNLMVNL